MPPGRAANGICAASGTAAEDKPEMTDVWLRASFMPLQANGAWHDEALRLARQRFSHSRTAVLRLTRGGLWQELLELQMDCSREIFEVYLTKSREMLGLVIPRIGEAEQEEDRGEAGNEPRQEKADEVLRGEVGRPEAEPPVEAQGQPA